MMMAIKQLIQPPKLLSIMFLILMFPMRIFGACIIKVVHVLPNIGSMSIIITARKSMNLIRSNRENLTNTSMNSQTSPKVNLDNSMHH